MTAPTKMVTIAALRRGLDAGRGDDQDSAAAARRHGHCGQLPPRLHRIDKGDTERALIRHPGPQRRQRCRRRLNIQTRQGWARRFYLGKSRPLSIPYRDRLVHGPVSPKVSLGAALRETVAVAGRIESGRLRPTSPFGLSYAIVSSIARRESQMVDEIAREVGLMEQRVMADVDEDPQMFLSELFAARHELLTIKTMAEQGGEIYRRAIKLTTFAPPEGLERMKDVLDQYETVARISEAQMQFQQGVTEFYRARTDTKMTIAAERLAVIAAITLPITSLSSVIGMNVIVNDSTRSIPLIILCLIMLAISLVLLRWTRKLGWW